MRNVRLKQAILAGLLAAMAFVLKLYFSITTFDIRLTFYEIPVLIGSVVLGPFLGGVIAFASDFAYITLAGFPFSFLLAFSAVVWGIVPGLMIKKGSIKTLIPVVFIVSILTLGINTAQLYIWTGNAVWVLFPLRLLITLLKWPLLVYVTFVVHHRLASHTVAFKKEPSR